MQGSAILTLFYAFLAATAVLVVASVWSGKTGRRKLHLALVAAMTASLLATLYFAKRVGEAVVFDPTSHDVHMPIARAAFFSLLGPLVTGPLYWKGKVGRKTHLVAVAVFLSILAVALGTGAWMMAEATAKGS